MNAFARSKLPGSWTRQEYIRQGNEKWKELKSLASIEDIEALIARYPPPRKEKKSYSRMRLRSKTIDLAEEKSSSENKEEIYSLVDPSL